MGGVRDWQTTESHKNWSRTQKNKRLEKLWRGWAKAPKNDSKMHSKRTFKCINQKIIYLYPCECVLDFALIGSKFECGICFSRAIFFLFPHLTCRMFDAFVSIQAMSNARLEICIKIELNSERIFRLLKLMHDLVQLPQSFSISEFSDVQFMLVNQNSCSPLWRVKQMRSLCHTHLI